jgi:DNA repair protein RadA/Sms
MARAKTRYTCSECGGVSPKWLGQCPQCEAWNTLLETIEQDSSGSRNRFASLAPSQAIQILGEVSADDLERLPTGIPEFDRVLGGGMVDGSVVLIGGDPGIGKSTLLLQALANLSVAHEVL